MTKKQRTKSKSPGRPKKHLHPSPGNIIEEGFFDAMYQPRSLSSLILLVVGIVYVTIYQEDNMLPDVDDDKGRVKAGILVSASAFLLYCMMQLRDGNLLRPHPAVWRVVHGTGLLYLMMLVYLLCQSTSGVHTFLKLFDERVGNEAGEHSYGDDCRMIKDGEDPYGNLREQFFDRFTVAHFLGWTVKAIILRDWAFMWIASVLFEILEVTFQHMYPNFNECWWDHLLLDIFGCNLAGMVFGMYLVHYLQAYKFHWTGQRIDRISSVFGKMKRVALQFAPYSFDTYRWQVFESWRRFGIGLSVMAILLLGEMNAFLLKSTFHIPIDSNINLYRLTFWVFITYMATFEFFRYAEGKTRRVGVNSWLAGSLVCMETALVIKHAYRNAMFERHEIVPASYIVNGWIATLVLAIFTGAVKSARKLLVWHAGGEEVYKPLNSPTKNQSDKTEKQLPDSNYILWIIRLDRAFQILTFSIPTPLLLVLAKDCYRTLAFHPPPTPGHDGW